MKLQARMTSFMPETPETAARVVAMLLARDGHIHWREMDLLERMDAFRILGIERGAFAGLAESIRAKPGCRPAAGGRVFEPELREIQDRRLQLLVSGLLVQIAEVDGEVAAEESALVRQAFVCWGVSPELLRRHMGIPVPQSLAALGMLPEGA